MTNAEIITIGDEILIGQIIDTNSAWIAQHLNEAGVNVKQITSVSDNRHHIISALQEAESRADIILITGGLGPTKDDITKNTLCDFFHTPLVFNKIAFHDVVTHFRSQGKEILEVNRRQAEVPANCKIIRNFNGTAPGMWFEKKGKVFISLPGVPYEMKTMMENDVLKKIRSRFKTPYILHRTVLTQGIGESFLAERISDWENALAADGIGLAYLPSPGIVRLRLSVTGEIHRNLKDLIDKQINELKKIIPECIFGYDDKSFEQIIGELLIKNGKTLSTAESCTGGYIAHRITSVAGSSRYFKGAIIAYSDDLKISELKVKRSLLRKYGAVSKESIEKMAKNVREKFLTDYSIACTGIAGPSGGSKEKPVGTVWTAVATPRKTFSELHHFGDNRERNIQRTAVAALNMLRVILQKP